MTMTLDEAIQHCKEQVQEQAKKGCYSCAEEHRQLAEWLKELKAYKEQRGERMNVEEKERLIKKDIASIENRVRHAFNQGYEMGLKENKEHGDDAVSRQAVMDYFRKWQPYMATRLWDFEKELSELPSVTPQPRTGQRTGRWEWVRHDGLMGNWHCSECRTIIPHMPEETDNTPIYKWCPMCGAKMEVEE